MGSLSPSKTCSRSVEFCLLGDSEGKREEILLLLVLPLEEFSPLRSPELLREALREWRAMGAGGCGTMRRWSLRPEERSEMLGLWSLERGRSGMALELWTRSLEG